MTVYAKGKRLHNKNILIFIHYETRQEICLTEDHAAGRYIDCPLPVLPRLFYPSFEEKIIYLFRRLPCQHSNSYLRTAVDKASAHRISVKITHLYDIAVFKTAHYGSYLIVKYPGSAAFEQTAFALFKSDYASQLIIPLISQLLPQPHL